MKLSDSPITQHTFNNVSFYLKRDDLLHHQFSGNKARKFMSLLTGEFPQVKQLVCYGSIQANSLYSLAALCAIRKWDLDFIVDHIPKYVKQKPRGNYRGALELGANIIDLSQVENRNGRHASQYILDNYSNRPNTLIVPEGGRSPIAEEGVKQLAQEIIQWTLVQPKQEWVVALPSGTGTTSLYLQKHLRPAEIKVITCACVGDKDYLIEQFAEVDNDAPHPTILASDKKHHFGRLSKNEYQLWQALEIQTQVEFDLLYDPFMWQCLLTWIPNNPSKTLLYIHQGGILGNESMVGRYRYWLDK
ncbi:1-aminocyclopropane-1-carboxylate deaminase/D-cysteine desulfhydrase [Vibrio sp. TH_r3]|uniref:1-aminocyclopropane-1-carboxylate deaminase/D-cysteine desulfhydrase n=1 Tax=Vibrio sp. TH_r3 TaxID=3082084 RepID=UPI002954F83A|nr:1-aminocyclopropane-1-carboxylate deaminase/D-cysteine desulfhydrase [Vibrio sp. TH_r3]MDV7104961.1 1-aminocyclopropane-1-carboxylate deaminase/D-cysteine desulfhydrase [Vibrio sp. TH_r3]